MSLPRAVPPPKVPRPTPLTIRRGLKAPILAVAASPQAVAPSIKVK